MYLAPIFQPNDSARQFIDIAYAYLDAAIELTDRMASDAWTGSYYRGQSVLWLSFHATEVFLKGCIRSAPNQTVGNLHSITELVMKFEEIFPSIKFQPLFSGQVVPPDPEIMKAAIKGDAELHQELRYPISSSGAAWPGIRAFDPRLFLGPLKSARLEFDRVYGLVSPRAGG